MKNQPYRVGRTGITSIPYKLGNVLYRMRLKHSGEMNRLHGEALETEILTDQAIRVHTGVEGLRMLARYLRTPVDERAIQPGVDLASLLGNIINNLCCDRCEDGTYYSVNQYIDVNGNPTVVIGGSHQVGIYPANIFIMYNEYDIHFDFPHFNGEDFSCDSNMVVYYDTQRLGMYGSATDTIFADGFDGLAILLETVFGQAGIPRRLYGREDNDWLTRVYGQEWVEAYGPKGE